MKNCLQCRYFYHGHKNEPSICNNKKSKKFPHKISKNGHDHICALFRPPKHRHDLVSETNNKSHNHPASGTLAKGKLRYIENLRNVYKNKEIFVLATGPSLDDIPRDFLNDKISIAVKEAAMPFPNCTYNIWPYRDYPLRHIYLPRHQIPSKFGKFIFTIRGSDRDNFYGSQVTKPIYLRYTSGGTIASMQMMCQNIIAGNSSMYFGIGTITHLAIAATLVMGAKKVSLIGCDHGAVNGKLRFQKGIMGGYGWGNADVRGYEDMKVGTNFLANFFRSHGIEIARYYHGKGYKAVGDIVKDKETIKRAEEAYKDIIKKGTDWQATKETL